jgi:hypothetical protein
MSMAVEECLTEHYFDKGLFQLTTDDLLDQLIFTLVQIEPFADGLMTQVGGAIGGVIGH